MAELNKTIDDSILDKISGGLSAEKRAALRDDLLAMIPLNIRGQLAEIRGNVELCKLLADNGVDVEKIEKKIKDAYAEVKVDLLSLSEKELANISGGVMDAKRGVFCECGNSNLDDFSYQFFVSQLMGGSSRAYRCKKCGNYVLIKNDSYRRYMTAAEYKDWHFYEDF